MLLKIGTSGFSFPDWVGTIYPAGIKPNEMLVFYERELGFKISEINFTYYAIPSPKSFQSMIKNTSPDFEFTVKAHKSMTHEIREKKGKAFIDNSLAFSKFLASIEPLKQEGRLSAVVAQFPFGFYYLKENFQYLLKFKEKTGGIPLVVEFRNSRWHNPQVIQALKKHEISYCIVDEPKLPGLMPYNPVNTTALGYFRLHGRNPDWFGAPLEVRYNYLYSSEELHRFVPDIKKIASRTLKTLVMFNNCHAGSAAKNAMEMMKLINYLP